MSTIVLDVQYLFNFVMESLTSDVTSILRTVPSINKAQEMIAQQFHSSTYNIFRGFETHATRMSYIRQNFGLVVSTASYLLTNTAIGKFVLLCI